MRLEPQSSLTMEIGVEVVNVTFEAKFKKN